MKYFVSIYCHKSWETGACDHQPCHPYTILEPFDSIRAANDRGYELIGIDRDDDLEWEVINEKGEVVC